MQPFQKHTGHVVTMDRSDVDTDQIIPKQFLKRIERTGFGQYLFYDWRYREDGTERADFELNTPAGRKATVLVARRNFGCGSSREHAAWALADFGFRVVIAPSFADIFYNNCFKNGILPIALQPQQVQQLFDRCERHADYQVTADLEACRLTDQHGLSLAFDVDGSRRHSLLNGLDDIDLTLKHEDKIAAFEAR